MMKKLYESFTTPGPEYRGKPFWAWNGELEKDELIRQVEVMKDMGFGGYFMHSRCGLITEYLGDEWFELCNNVADAGEKFGMESWLYDEDRWPSGSAGGYVTQEPKFRMKFINLVTISVDDFVWDDDIIKAYSCKLENKVDCYGLQKLNKDTKKADITGNTILVFKVIEMKKHSNYNGFTYADTINKEATEKFIELTHQKYKEKCGDRIGTTIKGIFTDEPHRGSLMTGFGGEGLTSLWSVPWSYKVFEEFKNKYGYDVEERLPELFLRVNGEKISQVKWHYVDLLQDLFLTNFMKPINDWCIENNMISTGHVLHEDSLTAQVTMQGSLMRSYEYMGYPGVDVLTEHNKAFWIVKQLTSAARQLGKKWMLSELYGCTGWQMNFESHKAAGDWQALYGINLRCPHLSWYTMEGEAKRDYPASILHQSGWYKDYGYVETYYARLGMLLMQGTPCCDILYILPIESLYAGIYPGCFEGLGANDADMRVLEENYVKVFNWLTGAGLDFDYGDEEMMSRLAKSKNGILEFGEAKYKTIVVGTMTTIRKSTLDILKSFVEQGGTLIFAGGAPEYVDAIKSDEAKKLSDKSVNIPFEAVSLVAACEKSVGRIIDIKNKATDSVIEDIKTQIRKDGDVTYIFAFNISTTQAYFDAGIRIYEDGFVQEWNCATGEKTNVKTTKGQGFIEIAADFEAIKEHVYILTKELDESLLFSKKLKVSSEKDLQGEVAYSLNEPNVCVLDIASYKYTFNGQIHAGKDEVLKIDQSIRTISSVPFRGGDMTQPWFDKFTKHPDLGDLEMSFEFNVEVMPEGKILLAVERPEHFTVKLNNTLVDSFNKQNWWIDESLKYAYIDSSLLVLGLNKIVLSTVFNQPMNIETIYLAGNFGVSLVGSDKTITTLPKTLTPDNIINQSLPFYSGAVSYKYSVPKKANDGERVFIEVPSFEGALVKITNNIGESKVIAWQPYEVDITDILDGSGKINIDVVLTRRNTFGPLHQLPIKDSSYGPWNFLTSGEKWSNDYMLYDAGLLKAPRLIIKK